MFTHDKQFYKSLILLALPIALQNLVTYLVTLADHLMIGSLGDLAVSGVYVGTQLQTVLQVLMAALESAVLLISAQYWGKHDLEAIRRIAAIGLDFSIGLGLFFSLSSLLFPRFLIGLFTDKAAVAETAADYLKPVALSYLFFCITQSLIATMRSVESPRLGLYVSLISLAVNVLLNAVLIFGLGPFPALGVRGAAIATVLARGTETLVIVLFVRFSDKKLLFRFRAAFTPDRGLAKDFCRAAVPLLLGQLVWGINTAFASTVIGHMDEAVITASSITLELHNLMFVTLKGMSGAVTVLVGAAVGKGDLTRIREYARTVQLLFLGLGLLTGLGFFLCRGAFISCYQISDEAAGRAMQLCAVISVTAVGTCYESGSLDGLVKAGGDVSFIPKNDTVFVFLVVIPLTLLAFFLGAPAWVVFLCLKCDQLLKSVVAFFKIRRYDWIKNLTKEVPEEAGA